MYDGSEGVATASGYRMLRRSSALRPDVTVDLKNVLAPSRVLRMACASKEDALNALVDALTGSSEVRDIEDLRRNVFERESLMSTGIGLGVAVPHVRIPSVTGIVMAVGVNAQPILDYETLDDEPVRILCLVAARDDQHAHYLRTLAAVSGILKPEEVRGRILSAETPEDIHAIFING